VALNQRRNVKHKRGHCICHDPQDERNDEKCKGQKAAADESEVGLLEVLLKLAGVRGRLGHLGVVLNRDGFHGEPNEFVNVQGCCGWRG